MSKESHSSNLRLLGSPVNLTYRGKKKDDKKNIRNRPRSALQNSGYKPDYHERYRRPYSADANPRSSTNKNLQKSFSIEVIQCTPKPIKVVPPTTEILGHSKKFDNYRNRDVCSNASDYGSEDTFISLGTKIKARAQSGPKPKQNKNFLKYREIAKNNKSDHFDDAKIDKVINDYNLEVKITEKAQGDGVFDKMDAFDDFDPFHIDREFGSSVYDARMPFEHCGDRAKRNCDTPSALTSQLTKAEDYYSRQLTKQQLSLVEEESTQEFSSISPENSLENIVNEVTTIYNIDDKKADKNNFKQDDAKDEYEKISQNFVIKKQFEDRSYKSFYDDLQLTNIEPYRSRLSSTIGNTDESCKDSGYTDSGSNEDKSFKRTYSSPTSLSKKIDSTIFEQPKSLDSASFTRLNNLGTEKKINEWSEPINHSRLLYKDFFLRKETNGPKVPDNSPTEKNNDKEVSDDKSAEYPSYLLNSTTKAYTSKVIEDYKKEIAAINNLHELTMKDIKIDAVSPTPLNIDKMFEQNSGELSGDSNTGSQDNISSKSDKYETIKPNKNERDVTKISTKELIQNYLKVKDNDFSKSITKNLSRFERKYSTLEKNLNNKTTNNTVKSDIPMNIKNQMPTSRLPLSARIEPVQNDKDIDSWMSLTVASPKNVENECKDTYEVKPVSKDEEMHVEISKPDSPKGMVKELSNGASVLDIYSMLKEIESFGDNPVNVEPEPIPEPVKNDEDISSNQKDNFMEIFDFLEKVEQSANDALAVVTNTTPQTIPKLESLLRLPQTELAQRLVTLSLQLEERSCCIALLQESLTNHKQQMVSKVSALEKQSNRNITKVKQECEDAIKRHQNFIDQLINDKKTLNHRIEQLVDERRSLEERWKRQAQALEDRYKLELKNQHDKMNAAQQVARQRWVRQKAEKIKELTVKGLEGELRDMADRQQKEVSDLKMCHAEQLGRMQAKHAADMEATRQRFEDEKEAMLLKERQMASSRLEKQILELELTYQEQRTRLIAEMRAENERVASGLTEREKITRQEIEKWRAEQEEQMSEKRSQLQEEIAKEKENLEEEFKKKSIILEEELERYKKQYEAEQQVLFKKKEKEICAQYKQERDKEIEKAIESMEAEAQVGRKELQEALRRNKEQYELELKELAETEQATLKRYQDAQSRIRITESKCPLHKFPKRHFRDRFNKWKAVLKEHTQNRSDTYLCNQVKLCYRHFEERFRLPSSLLTRNSIPTLSLTIVEETPTNTPNMSALQTAPEPPAPPKTPPSAPPESAQVEPTQIKIKKTKKDRKIRQLLLKLKAQRKQCAELEVTISKLETKNHLLTEKNMQLEQRTNEIKMSCEEKWCTKVEDLRKEMEDKTKKHEEQMHQLYAKVKIAVARKDSAMQALTREASKAQEKITLLEKKLQQQRKDFLKHK